MRSIVSGLAICLILLLAAPAALRANGEWQTRTTANGLASNAVTALAIDPEGRVWVGTTRGITLLDHGRRRTYTVADGLAENWITAIALDRVGRVWCGTYGGGLSVWDGQRWATFDSANSGLPSDWVTALAADGLGRIWAGTLGGGVSVVDGSRWTSYRAHDSGLPSDWISALAVGPQDEVWIGLSGRGVCRLAGSELLCFAEADSGLLDDDVTSLAVASDGSLWVGTEEGLAAYDTAGSWWRWAGAANLPGKRVRALSVDAAGRLWVGTGGGLSMYDGQNWRSYTRADGLAHDVVGAIAVGGSRVLVGTLGGGLSVLGAGEPESDPAYPVVLVHGWRGPDSDRLEESEFKYLARWLESDGRTVHYATGVHPDNTLHQNARALAENIARVKAATGAAAVDIIAFSMGGLNTRAYLESALYAGDVHQVFIMGTPHAGVTMWKTFLLHEIAHWSDEPSARELLPEQVALFNQSHEQSWGVPYTLFAGAVQADDLPPLFRFLPPSDGLISAWSAHELRRPGVRYVATDDLHAWSDETFLLDISSFLWPSDTYRGLLRPLLRGDDPQPEMAAHPGWALLPEEAHSPLVSGQIAPGQAVTHSLEIDEVGAHRIYARWQRGDLEFGLVDPTGRTYQPDDAASDDASYFALDFADFASFVITDAVTGAWSCRLKAPASPGDKLGYALYAVLDSQLRLEVVQDRTWYRQGETVNLMARLMDRDAAMPGADVKAEIYDPSHRSFSLPLHDDGQHGDGEIGDGLYGARWVATGPGGYYPLFLSANGLREGVAFARGAEGVIVVSRGTAELLGSNRDRARDLDLDGAWDCLEVAVAVGVHTGGDFLLAAQLTDLRGRMIGSVTLPIALGPGLRVVPLRFPGEWIHRHGANGPYLVAGLMLLDENGAATPLDQAMTFATDPYDWRGFSPGESAPAERTR